MSGNKPIRNKLAENECLQDNFHKLQSGFQGLPVCSGFYIINKDQLEAEEFMLGGLSVPFLLKKEFK